MEAEKSNSNLALKRARTADAAPDIGLLLDPSNGVDYNYCSPRTILVGDRIVAAEWKNCILRGHRFMEDMMQETSGKCATVMIVPHRERAA